MEGNKIRISTDRMLFFLLIINPILSLIFDGTTIYYHYILLPIVYILLGINLIRRRKTSMIYLMVSCCMTIVILSAFLMGADKGKINNHLFNYLDTIMLFIYFSVSKNLEKFKIYISQRINIVFLCVLIINIVEGYLLITKNGYEYQYSWGGIFFHGTNSMPHTLSYLMLTALIYVMVLVVLRNKRWYAIFAIIPLYCVFESGARVSLLLAGILGLILFDLVFSKHTESKLIKGIKVTVVLGICTYILKDQIMNSDLMSKIVKRSSSGNNSAGRMDLWLDLLSRYVSTPIHWLLGFGDDKVYYYSNLNPNVSTSIWAHNDFIQILFGKGIVGLWCYIFAMVNYIRTLVTRNGNYYSLLLIGFYCISAILNGFYSYKDISLAIPFMLMVNDYLYNKTDWRNEKI